MRYNPDVAPNPAEWLALDEGEQIAAVETYHRETGVQLPEAMLHAAIHAIVEQQLAAELPQTVNALARLDREGLDRHDSIHAIGAVLTEHMRRLMTGELDATDPNPSYFAALDGLSAESWRRELGSNDDV